MRDGHMCRQHYFESGQTELIAYPCCVHVVHGVRKDTNLQINSHWILTKIGECRKVK